MTGVHVTGATSWVFDQVWKSSELLAGSVVPWEVEAVNEVWAWEEQVRFGMCAESTGVP